MVLSLGGEFAGRTWLQTMDQIGPVGFSLAWRDRRGYSEVAVERPCGFSFIFVGWPDFVDNH